MMGGPLLLCHAHASPDEECRPPECRMYQVVAAFTADVINERSHFSYRLARQGAAAAAAAAVAPSAFHDADHTPLISVEFRRLFWKVWVKGMVLQC